jgi:tRNA A37 threonylcarbamoyladenosine biosynthesis protein TsaE
MWRINTLQELEEKGILDLIAEFEYIIIERPKFKEHLPLTNPIHITITKSKKDTSTREASITSSISNGK